MNTNEPEEYDDPPLDRWSVPLDEASEQILPFVPPPVSNQVEPTEQFPFPADADSIPSEGYHPRLYRFGEAA